MGLTISPAERDALPAVFYFPIILNSRVKLYHFQKALAFVFQRLQRFFAWFLKALLILSGFAKLK